MALALLIRQISMSGDYVLLLLPLLLLLLTAIELSLGGSTDKTSEKAYT
jgi:hypothetical protein